MMANWYGDIYLGNSTTSASVTEDTYIDISNLYNVVRSYDEASGTITVYLSEENTKKNMFNNSKESWTT